MTMMTEKDVIGRALGKISSGLYVITAGFGGDKQGMLASWVMQAGFEPPMVTIAVQRDRDMLALFESQRRCVINILSDGNTNMMGRFAKFKPDQFDSVAMFENDYGAVLQDTVAYLSCEIREKWVNGGDHVILMAEVKEGELLNPDLQPWTHVRKNGFVY